MRFKLGLIASFSFVGSMPALAEPYQWEIEGGYSEVEDKLFVNGDQDTKRYTVSGKYYFSAVETLGRPLAEAAFLGRASNINLVTDYRSAASEYQYCIYGEQGCQVQHRQNDMSQVGVGAGIEYFVPNSIFYLSASIKRSEQELEYRAQSLAGDSYYSYDRNKTYWSAAVGVMPVDGWLIAANFGENDEFNGSESSLETKYVLPLGERALNLTGEYYIDNHGYHYVDWKIGADYYFSPTFSVGGTYADGDTYGIRAEKFFTESFSLAVDYQEGDYEESFGVSLKARF